MDEYQEPVQHEEEPRFNGVDAERWLRVATLVLLLTAGVAFGYGYHERSLVHQLNTQVSTSDAQLSALQGQVSALTARLNSLSPAQPAAATPAAPVTPSATIAENASTAPVESSDTLTASASAPTPAAASPAPATPPAAGKPAHRKHIAPKKPSAVDAKFAKLQTQLDDQEKQLKETQDAMEKNRADLEGNISSTRDELNGSIARTHDELVVLEKRGERSYFEFDLPKSKQFQRIGPMTLSLRKADTKHKNYDLAMMVDDNELNKKKVNLYEPIWIHTENEGQPVQIVVNRIDKDTVHGYISAPKYKASELAAAGAASVTPVSNKAAGATNTPDQQPQPPQPQQ
jgi:chaperonin cofactor prefoldin